MISYGGNTGSLRVQRALSSASDLLSRSLERLSSGSRINRASDDAGSLAVASGLNATGRIYSQAMRNINDGASLIGIADSGLAQLTSILERQIELASQAANGSYSLTQRNALDREAQQLTEEFNRLVESTRFNGLGLFDGSNARVRIQAGVGIANSYSLDLLRTSASAQTTGAGTYTNVGGDHQGQVLAVGDINGDGRDDLITAQVTSTFLGGGFGYQHDVNYWVYVADSSGYLNEIDSGTLFSATDPLPASTLGDFHVSIGLGDQNGDNNLDIGLQVSYWSSHSSGSTLLVYDDVRYGNGAGAFGVYTGALASFSLDDAASGVGDFNGDGFEDTVLVNGQVNIQDTIINTVTTSESLTQNSISLTSALNALNALDVLRASLDTLSSRRGILGSLQSRLSTGLSGLIAQRAASDSAYSRIVDADIASDTANLTKAQILQQTSAQVLARANLNPLLALDLLRGSRA